jgi:primosomal protein N' (replication factor Y)
MPGEWAPGIRVRVPFGRSTLTGYIVAVTPQPEAGTAPPRIREVLGRLEETPSVSPELLALAEWVAERYLAPVGQCLRLAFPGAPDRKQSLPRAQAERATTPPSSGSASGHPTYNVERLTLNEALAPLRQEVLQAITNHAHASVLLPAATDDLIGFYLDAIKAALDAGRTALALVPEVGRIAPLQAWFTARWGTRCQAYHAGLSTGDRRRAWARIQEGDAAIVIGTRSAAFAPLSRLGLIIMDQEDHPAYKAENTPRYDARTIASERARRNGAALVLASAHPTLESAHATRPNWNVLKEEAPAAALPPVSVVDLRETPPGDILSAPMTEAVAARLADRKKTLLYLNRKGYAPVLLCRDCGQAVRCPACAVGAAASMGGIGLTFHKQKGVLRCPHCGHTERVADTCLACRGTRLVPAGFGTEALEEAVRLRFPTARVARLEGEGAAGARTNAAILSLMQAGELDILIGTQLVVTRHPRPVASLIGLIYADAALHLPDFRAAERAYHTLREVMALADPLDPGAGIVMQTYVPEHHVMRALALRDPSVFYENELSARASLGYPPFGRLIGLRVSGTKEDLVEAAAIRWATLLRDATSKLTTQNSSRTLEVLGPIPASPFHLRKRYRWQLAVKGPDGDALRQAVRASLPEMESKGRAGGLRYDVDVDPQSLL